MASVTADADRVKDVAEGYRQRLIQERLKSVVFYSFVVFVVLFHTLPLFWAVSQSFLDANDLQSRPVYIPPSPTLDNYDFIFGQTLNFTTAIRNSFIVASLTTVLCVIIGASSSYVLAQFSFRLKIALLGLILSMTMFPQIVIIVPLFVQYLFIKRTTAEWFGDENAINLVNSYTGILIPYIVVNLPLTVYLLYNFFQEIPDELVKAARVDGASDFQIFRKVILPLATPGIFTTAILVFIGAWNEFFFASILLSNVDYRTIPVALSIFQGILPPGVNTHPALAMMAATVTVTVPLIVLVLVFQRQIVQGLTAGAVKG